MEPADSMDKDRTTLAIAGMLPAIRFGGEAADIEKFTREMLDAARRFLPFIDVHTTQMHCAAVGTHPKTGAPVVDPAGLVPVYPDTLPRTCDLFTWPIRTAYKNVLFLGEGASGALGFEGAFVRAFMGFDVLKKAIQLKSVMST
jgi:hypothetical protein